MITEKEIKRAKIINYSCLGVIVFFTVLVLIGFGYFRYRHTFTPAKWEKDIGSRALIVGDLLDDYELIGMTTKEIEALLGENNNDFGYFVQENRYVYYLGGKRTFIDSEWLLIDFKEDVAVDYEITTD